MRQSHRQKTPDWVSYIFNKCWVIAKRNKNAKDPYSNARLQSNSNSVALFSRLYGTHGKITGQLNQSQSYLHRPPLTDYGIPYSNLWNCFLFTNHHSLIYPFIYIYPFTHVLIHQFTHLPIYPQTHLPIYYTTLLTTHYTTQRKDYCIAYTNLLDCFLFTNPHSLIYPFTHVHNYQFTHVLMYPFSTLAIYPFSHVHNRMGSIWAYKKQIISKHFSCSNCIIRAQSTCIIDIDLILTPRH